MNASDGFSETYSLAGRPVGRSMIVLLLPPPLPSSAVLKCMICIYSLPIFNGKVGSFIRRCDV